MKLKLLGLIVGLQVAWILYTVAVQESHLAHAETVLLETQPVDPRDLLRGDYVILNYTLSRLSADLFTPAWTNRPAAGTTVFVLLEKRGEFHEAVGASLAPSTPAKNQVLLRGTMDHRWGGAQDATVNVRYGLERYYVPEGTGNPEGTITVQAAVSQSGRALIREVFINGKPYREVMKGSPQ